MVECSETVLRRCRMQNSLNWKIKRSQPAQISRKGFGNFDAFCVSVSTGIRLHGCLEGGFMQLAGF